MNFINKNNNTYDCHIFIDKTDIKKRAFMHGNLYAYREFLLNLCYTFKEPRRSHRGKFEITSSNDFPILVTELHSMRTI